VGAFYCLCMKYIVLFIYPSIMTSNFVCKSSFFILVSSILGFVKIKEGSMHLKAVIHEEVLGISEYLSRGFDIDKFF